MGKWFGVVVALLLWAWVWWSAAPLIPQGAPSSVSLEAAAEWDR